jgi:nickel/cobalt exporter
MIRAAKADGSAVYGLLGLSFTYGILHAAGPGHGKAVISSYLIANGETWRRGVVLSFASAFLQALAAVAMVGIAAAMLGATAATMGSAVRVIEIASLSHHHRGRSAPLLGEGARVAQGIAALPIHTPCS